MPMDASSSLERFPFCNAVLFTQQALTSGKCPFCVPNPELENDMPVGI